MKKITVVGSISMDLVTTTNRVPNSGETVFGEQFAMVPGGKGANQAVAMARLVPDLIEMIGAVGADSFGEEIRKKFYSQSCFDRTCGNGTTNHRNCTNHPFR